MNNISRILVVFVAAYGLWQVVRFVIGWRMMDDRVIMKRVVGTTLVGDAFVRFVFCVLIIIGLVVFT